MAAMDSAHTQEALLLRAQVTEAKAETQATKEELTVARSLIADVEMELDELKEQAAEDEYMEVLPGAASGKNPPLLKMIHRDLRCVLKPRLPRGCWVQNTS